MNRFILAHLPGIEMAGVMTRIFSFSIISWMGAESPHLFIWILNTADAVVLSWCSFLKRDRAYTVLNVFWILIGVIGILRAGVFIPKI